MYLLPLHLRRGSHTLSLIATIDNGKCIKKSSVGSTVKIYHHTAFAKCRFIWNAFRKPKTSEQITKRLGSALKFPIQTRWNSLYDSLSRLIKHKDKLNYLLDYK